MNHRRRKAPALLAALVILLNLPSAARPAGADPATDALLQTMARPLERTAPRYPARAVERGLEGWVDVSFVVEPDGTVSDPIVEESSGVASLEQAALEAVRSWRYEPATRNGEPVQQCEVRSRLTFEIDRGTAPGATRGYVRRYRAINRLMEEGRLDEARDATLELQRTEGLNLYEAARSWALLAMIDQRAGTTAETRVHSLRRAAANSRLLGDPQLHLSLLENLLAVELELRHYRRAMDTAERLREEHTDASRRPALDRVISQLRALRDDDGFLSVRGHIQAQAAADDTLPFFTHQPLRRKVGLEDVDGRISGIDLRCQWHRVLLTHDADIAVRLPDDWGSCDVYVYGEPGTTFTLVEYPLAGG